MKTSCKITIWPIYKDLVYSIFAENSVRLSIGDLTTGLAFYRAMLCIRGTSHGPVSVSVCPSVTSRSSAKTAKRRITQTTPHDTPVTLVFDAKKLREIRPGSPSTWAPNAGGVGQNRRLSTNNRLYLENGTR